MRGIALVCTTGSASDNSLVATLGVGIGRSPGISSDTTIAHSSGSRDRYWTLFLWILDLQTLHFTKQAMYRARFFRWSALSDVVRPNIGDSGRRDKRHPNWSTAPTLMCILGYTQFPNNEHDILVCPTS